MAHLERQLVRIRKRLEGARLYAGFTGSGKALDLVARLERLYWRFQAAMDRLERKCA
jgi:hypothetical protein